MARLDWTQDGRTWLCRDCPFFVVERAAPELAGRPKGTVEYHVIRGGGDDLAGFPAAVLATLEEAIAEAELRHDRETLAR